MVRVPAETLRSFAERLVESMGSPPEIASPVADSLVRSDSVGHSSHGIHRLVVYADLIDDGTLDPRATPSIDHGTAVTASVDGRRAYGQVVGRRAVDLGIDRAAAAGLAVVGIRDGTHLGRVGEWAERAADAGYLFVALVNTQAKGATVAPAGSAQRRLATNPLAFGVPTLDALDFPIVVDMATSQVAHGKIRDLAASDASIPAAWTVTEDGTPVTDATAFEDGAGALLPLGGQDSGYKGYALAVVVELFAGFVGDAPVYGQSSPEPFSNAGAFVFVDPTVFTTREAARDRVAALAAYLHETEAAPAVSAGVAAKGDDDEVILPGEGEHRTRLESREQGVVVRRGILDALVALAYDRGVPEAIPPALED